MTKKIAVLTGAGISTSAGIPDFRGPDGVWTKHPDQMSVYDIDLFLRNKEDREYSWRWQKESPVWNAQPGTAHKALVKLEQAGMLTLLATQEEEPDPHCHRKLKYRGDMPCNGIIKTDVVYFGEALPDGAMEKSYSLATKADELWVIGSTLEVYPAASIVPVAAQAGVPITIMNMGHTQYDHLASRLIHEDIAVALPKLVDETIAENK